MSVLGPDLDGPHRRTLTPAERADRLAALLLLLMIATAVGVVIVLSKG